VKKAKPHLIWEGEWEIKDTTKKKEGKVLLSKKQLFVPNGNSPMEIAIRAHEYGHIKWSPLRLKLRDNLEREIFKGVEDCRINILLQEQGINLELLATPDEAKAWLEKWKLKSEIFDSDSSEYLALEYLAVLAYLYWEGYSGASFLRESLQRVISKEAMNLAQSCLSQLRKEPSLKCAVQCTKKIAQYFKDLERKSLPSSLFRGLIELSPVDKGKKLVSTDFEWANMEILKPRLVYPCRRALKDLRDIRLDAGFRLEASQVWRVWTDGVIWKERRKSVRESGTILLDMSASMGLSKEEVERLLLMNPGGILAGYASAPNSLAEGRLIILAKQGYYADIKEIGFLHGRGNTCDLLALEWLARQSKPRIWISDGIVTGVGDVHAPKQECDKILKILKDSQIVQYLSISAFFNGKKCKDFCIKSTLSV